MVYHRFGKNSPDSHSGSDLSSDSTEDDLEYLIDDLLEKLVVCTPGSRRMTIKNRKERPKHERQDRSNEVEAAGTSKDDSYPFGLPRYGFSSEVRNQTSGRSHSRTPWAHTSAASGALSSEPFAFSTYTQPGSSRLLQSTNYIQPPLKRHWTPSLDQSNTACKERLNEEQLDSDDAAGNNSEDEYHQIPEKTAETSSKLEDNGLEQLLKEKKGWKVIHVRGDGACLFRSVSHQVFGDEEKHDIIRKQVVDYMVKNREHFSQYVTEDFDRYLQRKCQPACHGNHLEIQAISELYNRPVEIYYNSVVPINVFHAEYSREVPIRLCYYGRTHYNSIIDPCKPGFGQGLGMPNYQPGLPEKDLVNQAINESESSELEEAMLRDKLAESDAKELDDCIAEAVLRESYFEHLKICYDMSTKAPQPTSPSSTTIASTSGSRKATPPPRQLSKPLTSAAVKATCSESTSGLAQACSSSAASSSTQIPPSASADPRGLRDFAILQYMPENMLDMNEDDVLAIVLEQSRSDYINSLRPAKSKDPATAQSYFRQQLNDALSPSANAQQGPSTTLPEKTPADSKWEAVP